MHVALLFGCILVVQTVRAQNLNNSPLVFGLIGDNNAGGATGAGSNPPPNRGSSLNPLGNNARLQQNLPGMNQNNFANSGLNQFNSNRIVTNAGLQRVGPGFNPGNLQNPVIFRAGDDLNDNNNDNNFMFGLQSLVQGRATQNGLGQNRLNSNGIVGAPQNLAVLSVRGIGDDGNINDNNDNNFMVASILPNSVIQQGRTTQNGLEQNRLNQNRMSASSQMPMLLRVIRMGDDGTMTDDGNLMIMTTLPVVMQGRNSSGSLQAPTILRLLRMEDDGNIGSNDDRNLRLATTMPNGVAGNGMRPNVVPNGGGFNMNSVPTSLNVIRTDDDDDDNLRLSSSPQTGIQNRNTQNLVRPDQSRSSNTPMINQPSSMNSMALPDTSFQSRFSNALPQFSSPFGSQFASAFPQMSSPFPGPFPPQDPIFGAFPPLPLPPPPLPPPPFPPMGFPPFIHLSVYKGQKPPPFGPSPPGTFTASNFFFFNTDSANTTGTTT